MDFSSTHLPTPLKGTYCGSGATGLEKFWDLGRWDLVAGSSKDVGSTSRLHDACTPIASPLLSFCASYTFSFFPFQPERSVRRFLLVEGANPAKADTGKESTECLIGPHTLQEFGQTVGCLWGICASQRNHCLWLSICGGFPALSPLPTRPWIAALTIWQRQPRETFLTKASFLSLSLLQPEACGIINCWRREKSALTPRPSVPLPCSARHMSLCAQVGAAMRWASQSCKLLPLRWGKRQQMLGVGNLLGILAAGPVATEHLEGCASLCLDPQLPPPTPGAPSPGQP